MSLELHHYRMAQQDRLLSQDAVQTALPALNYIREDVLDLPDQRREVRIVVYGIIGQLRLLVQRNLKFFANFDFLLIQEARLFGSAGPLCPVALDENQPIATVRPSNFHQQGHVKYNRSGRSTVIILNNQLLGSFQYARMNHFVQSAQFLGIGKNYLRQLGPVDLARGLQNLPAELLHELLLNRLFLQEIMSKGIGADDRTAQFAEFGGHSALARGDTAKDSNDWFFPGIAHDQAVDCLFPLGILILLEARGSVKGLSK